MERRAAEPPRVGLGAGIRPKNEIEPIVDCIATYMAQIEWVVLFHVKRRWLTQEISCCLAFGYGQREIMPISQGWGGLCSTFIQFPKIRQFTDTCSIITDSPSQVGRQSLFHVEHGLAAARSQDSVRVPEDSDTGLTKTQARVPCAGPFVLDRPIKSLLRSTVSRETSSVSAIDGK